MDRTIEQLSDYVVALQYADLPQEVVHQCKRRVIDALGCAMGAFTAEPSKIARAVARRGFGDPPARILGTQEESSPELAAFANGVMIRYLDCNDAYRVKSGGHPSDVMAAVLAVADAVGADGETVIVAITAAYEVFGNFCETVNIREKGWDHPTYGVIASAVGAGKVLELSKEAMGHAIALAIIPNMALEETRRGELSMWKGCAAANASRNGVFAAMLAEEGLTGPPTAIEGPHGLWNAVTGPFEWQPFGGRGGPFRVAQTHLKYFPAEYHTQAPTFAALELRRQVNVEDIESINIDTYWMAWSEIGSEPEKWHPTTRETADHSLPFIVSSALTDGTITPATFSEERIRDPKLNELMQKVKVRENPELTKQYPNLVPCRMEIVTKTGERKVATVSYPKGHLKNPMSDAEIEDKFRRLAGDLFTSKQTGAILESLWGLEQVEDIGEVLELFAV